MLEKLKKVIPQHFKSRKLVGSAVLYITATVFVILEEANFDQWSSFMQWIFGIYAAGNVGEHFKDAWKERKVD